MTIENYLEQIKYEDYEELPDKLYDFIKQEGWLSELENFYNTEFDIDDFEYLNLGISMDDKLGLIQDNNDIIDKFNKLDIEIKKISEYPYDTLDFIDYTKGIVHIIKLI